MKFEEVDTFLKLLLIPFFVFIVSLHSNLIRGILLAIFVSISIIRAVIRKKYGIKYFS
ncbi:hypothetical protein [Clostridium pasteurianum]|uniref:Uncharacterized protein n=1 Tax=Clostridium pasteurianum BC1 TaxID=86416 RepID=R4K4Z7_CLOPA|nr:hypothetical protein [Clostridium pasteurianum]AGK96786.1 hypothetical protein Clopa_1886 [Clostridium pasteurianum BC1]